MTVGELIKELQSLNADDVVIENIGGYAATIEVGAEPLEDNPEKVYVYIQVL